MDGIDFGARHGARDFREFDGERAAEAAAFFSDIHLSERKAVDLRKELSRAGFDVQLTESMATVVIGDDAVEPRADIFDAGDFQEKSRKLPHSRLQTMDLGEGLGIMLKNVRKVMRDHRRAGARRYDDVFRIAENVEEMPGDGASLVRITRVEGGLAAASLSFGKIDLIAQTFEHFCDGDADLRKDLIDDAGDKQGDTGAHSGSLTW